MALLEFIYLFYGLFKLMFVFYLIVDYTAIIATKIVNSNRFFFLFKEVYILVRFILRMWEKNE